MTAEIAVLNKSAVALAADSAVTIGGGASAKIYNTVNKIFEISERQPIGLMVYGSLEYMEVPIETIAKKFRKEIANNTVFNTTGDCMDRFIKFLSDEIHYDDQIESNNVYKIIYDKLINIDVDIERAIRESILKQGKFLRSKINATAQQVIQREIDRLNALPPAEGFSAARANGVTAKYGALVPDLITDCIHWNLSGQTRAKIIKLIGLVLHRAELSQRRTGIVIAGFGETQMFPSLCSCEIDGIVNGQLKRSVIDHTQIDRAGVGADVKAFAQREMVERFLQGVDPVYDRYVQNRLVDAMTGLASEILAAEGNTGATLAAKLNGLTPVIEQIRADYVSKSEAYKNAEFRNTVLNMVQFMPNQELATLADSLVDLTSLKRRVSAERETVGGAVDVAVISKSEGFVWIRRKHYFPADINPRFFRRHYHDDQAPSD